MTPEETELIRGVLYQKVMTGMARIVRNHMPEECQRDISTLRLSGMTSREMFDMATGMPGVELQSWQYAALEEIEQWKKTDSVYLLWRELKDD